jgi:hypothetical protein
MKTVTLIILLLYLLLPLVCFADPCYSCLGSPDAIDTSGKSGSHSQSQDVDSCDSAVCCAESICLNSKITIVYAPLVSVLATLELYQKLAKVVIPIFIPPQNLA